VIEFNIPWTDPGEWTEIHQNFDFLIEKHAQDMDTAREAAMAVQIRLESLFPLMDDLCHQTCASCAEPCCRVAKLWYNFQDLLFLHLIGRAPPESQPLETYESHCRYLMASGCSLPRIIRPWICTWYICHPQTAALRRRGRAARANVEKTINEIKQGRKNMEDAFIHATWKDVLP
jgi:hypothetical protein